MERIPASIRNVSFTQCGQQPAQLKNHEVLSDPRNIETTRAAIESVAHREWWTITDVESIPRALGLDAKAGLRVVDV